MEIKASMVKELRDKTGAGMMDAKKALVETNGDMDKAVELLRQKGMASADKKMGIPTGTAYCTPSAALCRVLLALWWWTF